MISTVDPLNKLSPQWLFSIPIGYVFPHWQAILLSLVIFLFLRFYQVIAFPRGLFRDTRLAGKPGHQDTQMVHFNERVVLLAAAKIN